MAHSWEPAREHGKGHRTVSGSFIPNGASNPATRYGTGFAVTRAAAGRWLVTLEEPFADYVSITPTLQLESADVDHHEVRVGDISVANRTFEILHLTSADVSGTDVALADITASGVARKVHFLLKVAEEKIPGAGV